MDLLDDVRLVVPRQQDRRLAVGSGRVVGTVPQPAQIIRSLLVTVRLFRPVSVSGTCRPHRARSALSPLRLLNALGGASSSGNASRSDCRARSTALCQAANASAGLPAGFVFVCRSIVSPPKLSGALDRRGRAVDGFGSHLVKRPFRCIGHSDAVVAEQRPVSRRLIQ